LRRDESGAALVEFAVVMSLFVFILYGLIAFGMALALKQSMTSAAADAARSAIGATDPVAAAQATVAQRLGWLGSRYQASDSPAPVVAQCPNDASKQCIRVQLNYPYGSRPLVPLAGLGPSTIHTESWVQIS
jgi:Flp pilus assembly pilin Flp